MREGDIIQRARAFECEGGCERSEMEGVNIATTQDLLDFLGRHKGENVVFAIKRGDNLIVTMETNDLPINLNIVKEMVNRYCL